MDWNIFWSAFGAIGSTIGSIAMAIAVIIAVKQLKQPKEIEIKIKYFVKEEYPMDENPLFHILIINDCFKTIFIESIGYEIKNKYIQLQHIATNIQSRNFPYNLKQDTFLDITFKYETVCELLKKENKNNRIYFVCKDSLKNTYKTKYITIQNFLNLYDETMDYSNIYLDP